jgi:two-component system chemotaxis response regulator CheB
MEPIKVLVVDDSSLVRKILTDALQKDPAIEVVGTANNGKSAIYKSEVLDPDVITMDIEMPIMNGLDALKEIMKTNPKPVIMMSVLTHHGAAETIQALEYGAVDFVPKPSTILNMSVEEIYDLLITKVKSVYKLKFKIEGKRIADSADGDQGRQKFIKRPMPSRIVKPINADFGKGSNKIVGIGTSTGGPSALLSVFQMLPENFPSPVVVVQHMPVGFTEAFAERLHNTSQLNVKEAEDGDRLLPGHAYIARGDSHMAVSRQKGGNFLKVYSGHKVSGHCPSIDVLFDSMAQAYTEENIAAIMTGMGKDGAQGILNIKNGGGYTIAQNEDTSIVYGMNRVAVELGAIYDEVPLLDIAKKIVDHIL